MNRTAYVNVKVEGNKRIKHYKKKEKKKSGEGKLN